MRGLHLALALLLTIALGVAIERTLGRASQPTGPPVLVEDPGGRRLFVLILDSLTPQDAALMPTWQALEARGRAMELEPCLERITYMCVRDALTGRSAFTLFGVLENWGTAMSDPGDNLLRDARAAGRTVAMVSAGDIAPFAGDLDAEQRFPDRYREAETEAAVAYAKDHDLVVYHYIWHDTQAHHNAVGSKAYLAGLARMDEVLKQVIWGLPGDMDLLVFGDHGHSDDGRHVQGQDIPTRLVVLSPRVTRGAETERIPIHAVRFIGGTVLGLASDRMEWDPAWSRWLEPGVSPALRELVESGSPPRHRATPWGPVVVLLLTAAVAAHGAGLLPAGLLALAGVFLGLAFEAWLAWMHFPGERPRVDQVLWWLPAALAALGLLGGRRWAWRLPLGFSLAALLLLYPVLHHYGVLQNLGSIGLAALAGPVLVLLWPPRHSPRTWAALVLAGALAYTGWWWMADVRVFNLEIVRKWGAVWVRDVPWLAVVLNALFAGGLQRVLDRDSRLGWVLLAAAGSGLGHLLPPLAAAVPVAGVLLAMSWQGRHHGRWLGLATAWAMPYLYGLEDQHGIYAIVLATGAGLFLVDRASARLHGEGPWPAVARWSGGVLVAAGGYLAMAWTFGLAISTLDFTFTLPWLPGRLHERLWWLIFILTTAKCVLPVALVPPLARGLLGERAEAPLRAGEALVLLRFLVIVAFAVTWVVATGSSAGGLRLAAILQDAFFWVLIGVTLRSSDWIGQRSRRALPQAGIAVAP